MPTSPARTTAPTTDALLRGLVLDLVTHERARRFPARLHVGRPGRERTLEAAAYDDDALRADAVTALLDPLLDPLLDRARAAGDEPLAWLTRGGEVETTAADLSWLRAVHRAAAEAGTRLRFVVVTRRGWTTPATGERRTWQRLRPAGGRPPTGAAQSQPWTGSLECMRSR